MEMKKHITDEKTGGYWEKKMCGLRCGIRAGNAQSKKSGMGFFDKLSGQARPHQPCLPAFYLLPMLTCDIAPASRQAFYPPR